MANAAKKTSKKETEVAAEPKLRIRVRAYEHKILDLSVKQIMDTANRFDAKIVGPVPLPTEIKRWTVNRSTFIDKDSREQFEMRIHKRLIDIMSPNSKVIEALTNLNLPSGVTIDVKMAKAAIPKALLKLLRTQAKRKPPERVVFFLL
jgi:small subunit ribosomal protein S10